MRQSDQEVVKKPEDEQEDEAQWDQPQPKTAKKREIKITKKGTIFRIAGIMGVLAGIDIILSGYTSHSLIVLILAKISSLLPLSIQPTISLILTVLNFIAAASGALIIAGAVLFLLKHGFFGRLLIRLGGGMGIFGLLFAMGEAYYTSGMSTVVFHGEYWIGIILTTAAIWLSKRA
jgi:hypothetical protein